MSGIRDRIRKRKKDKLLEDGGEEEGLSNPSMDDEIADYTQPSGTDSSPEMEAAEADALVKTLKTKRTKKKRELAQEVTSPKDDLARELKEAKKKSKAKVDESVRQELEETAVSEVADDGTLPMPEGEEGEAVPEEPVSPKEEGEEESRIKKLRRKKEPVEETPIEPPPEGEEAPPAEEEEKKEEPSPRPPSAVEAEPETERKTPRMASMRAKMKERLAKAKEEAMTEVKEEAKESRRERRLQRDKTQKTRFDTDMEAEELERMTEEKRKLREERKKKLAATRKEGVYMPTAEESFDFFTRVWEPEPEEEEEEPVEKAETEKKEKKEKKEGEEEEEAKEGEEPKEEGEEGEVEPKPGKAEDEQPLIPPDEEEIGYALTVMSRADFPDPDEVIRNEDKLYFYPSSSEIPATDKVAEEMEVRRLEEEGFYVGTRPSTSGWNQNRMEHRLLKESEVGKTSSKKWFGEDGKLLALPDPLKVMPSRPPITEEVEPYLQTVYKKAIMREFDSRYIDGTTEGGGQYQLDVDINQICFSHHHLYSREHVLAQKLSQMYYQYILRQKKNMTEYLGQKLKALKGSALHLQDHIAAHRSEHSLTDRSNYERRLQEYKTEIKQARLQRDREEKSDRTLLKNMIHTWKEIRAQRDLQRFTNTPVKLQIRKEEVDKAQDQAAWKLEIEDEVEELRDENEREYKHKMLTYEEEMAKYQKQVQAKKEAEKRLRKKKGRKGSKQSRASALSGGSGLEDYNEEAQQKDQEILDEADLTQPEPPEQFDENEVREQVKAKAMESRRRPGEPKLDLELSNTASITPTAECPSGEQRRRDDVSKCKVFIKILFNNKEVSRTNAKPLSQDFKVNYGQIYNMKILQWPESISFQVYESVGFSSHLMAELCAPIPDTSVTSLSVQLEDLEFSSDHRINHSHEGVGSGLPFTFGKGGQELITLMTTGVLTFSVAWAVNEHGQALVPVSPTSNITSMFNHMKKMDPLAAIGATGVMDIQKLADWFYDSRLDPNDPSNADIVYILRGKSGDSALLSPTEYFRLEQLMEEFDFVADDEMQANRRFQLLQLRDEEVQEFRNYKMVPAYDREVPRDTFTDYERKKREEQKLRQMDDIESHRAAVKRFRQRIREQVMRRFRVQSHMKRWEDMVYEEAVPNIAILGTNLLKVFERKAPLKPRRKERKKVTAQNIKGDEVKILVNISRAQNVPIRMAAAAAGSGTMTARETDRRKQEELIEGTTVRPFIEVMFQHNCIRTSVGDGSNPSFNEELEIPFKAPNDDFSPSNLQTCGDSIFLNLFDEVVVDIQQDDRERGSSVHQRIEKKWLGSLKIPFSTVYFNGKIDGSFRVNAPPVLLGYLNESLQAGEMDVGLDKDIKTLLTMFITIEPPLRQPEPTKERFSTNEDEKLMVFADEWQERISALFTPKREVKTFVTDTNFKSVFITRYFKAIKPPDEITSKGLSAEATSELVARYVSLIPFVSDTMIFPGLCDIWNTCDQFLQMLSGDEEEHAILLVNFFLSLGKKAWLICGSAIPEGPTAYVLTEEASGYWVWNPSSGEHFRTQDTNSPLQTIGCLVNHENIWANIQQYDKPSQIMYNFADTAQWEPIFTKRYPSPGLGSIQPDSLYYFPTDKDYVVELQEKIQSTLKNKIMDWRSRYITRWNRHCTQIMRKMLPVLEENCGKSVGEQHIHELEQSFSSYKVSGFPINMPFTEIEPIVETVYATGVHSQESSDVEFALAVYVHPYPNSVLSVWVYVASLMRLR